MIAERRQKTRHDTTLYWHYHWFRQRIVILAHLLFRFHFDDFQPLFPFHSIHLVWLCVLQSPYETYKSCITIFRRTNIPKQSQPIFEWKIFHFVRFGHCWQIMRVTHNHLSGVWIEWHRFDGETRLRKGNLTKARKWWKYCVDFFDYYFDETTINLRSQKRIERFFNGLVNNAFSMSCLIWSFLALFVVRDRVFNQIMRRRVEFELSFELVAATRQVSHPPPMDATKTNFHSENSQMPKEEKCFFFVKCSLKTFPEPVQMHIAIYSQSREFRKENSLVTFSASESACLAHLIASRNAIEKFFPPRRCILRSFQTKRQAD